MLWQWFCFVLKNVYNIRIKKEKNPKLFFRVSLCYKKYLSYWRIVTNVNGSFQSKKKNIDSNNVCFISLIWIKENRTDRKCVHWFEPCMKEFLCFMRNSWRYLASIVEKKKACAGSYVVFFYDDCFLHSPFIVEIYETPEEILTLFAWYKIYPTILTVLWCIAN